MKMKHIEKVETVIGLEVHVELDTKTKIFCSCQTDFGGEPNTHCCPVCMGMPGTLPVINRQVVEYALAVGLATNCDITRYMKFDRKNYFYPDLPKAYQVSQLYLPICRNGSIEIETEQGKKSIGIHEIHMEEDAGKLIHDEWEDCTLVDYNRCGVPLLEIVSEPDLRSANEAVAYLEKLKLILQYLGVSDCKMQEGSLRADVNVSIREYGQSELGTRTEMKNLNSFKAIARAIEGETVRQLEMQRMGKPIIQETRRWDDNKGTSFSMRSKEDAQDYRYFPEPDLLPVKISEEWISQVKERQPELKDAKKERYMKELGLPEYDADILTASKQLADLFEDTVKLGARPKEVSNWLMVETMRLVRENEIEIESITFSADHLQELINLIEEGKINRTVGKEVFEVIFNEDISPIKYVEDHGLLMVNDDRVLKEAVHKVLKENEKSVNDFRKGKERAFGYLVGQTMKAMAGKANPQGVKKALEEALNSGGEV